MAYSPNFNAPWAHLQRQPGVVQQAASMRANKLSNDARLLQNQQLQQNMDTVQKEQLMKDEARRVRDTMSSIAPLVDADQNQRQSQLAMERQKAVEMGDTERVQTLERLIPLNDDEYRQTVGMLNSKAATTFGIDALGEYRKQRDYRAVEPVAPTSAQKDYMFYRQQELGEGRKPKSFDEWSQGAPQPTANQSDYDYYWTQSKRQGIDPMPFGEWVKGSHSLSKPIPAVDADGNSIYVQMNEKTGQLVPVEGYGPPKKGPLVSIDQSGPDIGAIPQGWYVEKDDKGKYSMAPIPGGPAEKEQMGLDEKKELKSQQGKYIAAIVSEDVDRAVDLVIDNPLFTTGLVGGQVLSNLGGTDARRLETLLDTIKANTGFQNLSMLRASSPTGGALGPVSDTENKLLQSAFGSVEQSTTAEDLEFNLNRLKAIYNLTVHGSPEPPPYISEYAKEAEASQASQYNDMSLEQLEAREAELLKQLGQ